jgi:hypothetical protein
VVAMWALPSSTASASSGEKRMWSIQDRIRLLWLAISRAWWTDPGPAPRRILVDAARRVGGATDRDPRVLAIYACADPVGHAAEVLPRLQAVASRAASTPSPYATWGQRRSSSAFDIAVGFLAFAAKARAEGRLGQLPPDARSPRHRRLVPRRLGRRRSRRGGGAAACDRARQSALDRGRRNRSLPGRRHARRRGRRRTRCRSRRAAGPDRRRQSDRRPRAVRPRAQRAGGVPARRCLCVRTATV